MVDGPAHGTRFEDVPGRSGAAGDDTEAGWRRTLGIPTIRDRVVQTAAKLVLEPIFEADFDSAYGCRRAEARSMLSRKRTGSSAGATPTWWRLIYRDNLTSAPALTSASTKWLPMNPLAPVTNTRFPEIITTLLSVSEPSCSMSEKSRTFNPGHALKNRKAGKSPKNYIIGFPTHFLSAGICKRPGREGTDCQAACPAARRIYR
jgi:hypothetical protein